VLCWFHAAPRQRTCVLSMTSAPDFGIGNGMPPNAPLVFGPAAVSCTVARVAFWKVLSYTHCGAAAVRCVG
jgi:hypothetical protein